jgi:hypothetical protein
MTSRPASLAVLDGGTPHDLFEVIDIADGVLRVRSPFLFEIGEELAVRVDDGTATYDARATVRAHTGPAGARVTELILERGGST